MSDTLLTRIRRLNWAMSESMSGYIAFKDLCRIVSQLLNSNTYILDRKGKVLASYYREGEEAPLLSYDDKKTLIMPEKVNEKLLMIGETKENLSQEHILHICGADYNAKEKFHLIVPIIFGGRRVATVIAVRSELPFSDEDIAICEYGATIVGIEVATELAQEDERHEREIAAVKMALETLSYSELDAVEKIFEELDGDDGVLVASKIADKSGITRSVIVNALRKLESAGVIESRSLGMKGTRIKVTNGYLRKELHRITL